MTATMDCNRFVLIVDDDPDIRGTLCDFLEDNGFVVKQAADGVEALSVLAHGDPCFVLLDLMMPTMNGWELIRHLETDHRADHIPIYISTSAPDQAPSGFPLLSKPTDLGLVLAAITRHCAG